MKPSRSPTSLVGFRLLVVASALSSGCGEELGPVAMPVTRVQGIVKEGDRPVSGGWIEFTPVDGTVGKLRSARLGLDGRFDAAGVAVGRNAIRFVNARIESPVFRQLFTPYTSPIRREVAAVPSAPMTIDLVEEAVRFERDRRRALAGNPPPTGIGMATTVAPTAGPGRRAASPRSTTGRAAGEEPDRRAGDALHAQPPRERRAGLP